MNSFLTGAGRGALSVVFQPIVDVHRGENQLHALECLIRGPVGTALEAPKNLFECAFANQQQLRLDRLCMTTALDVGSALPGKPVLCINALSSTLGQGARFTDRLEETLAARALPPERVVLEVVEHDPLEIGLPFLRALDRLRSLGVRIALDDVGRGKSNYQLMLELRPDYLKIDRHFVSGVRSDPYRRAVLESIAQLASRVEAQVIAEGVENRGDLAVVAALGIHLIQGFLFCPPLPATHLMDQGFLTEADSPTCVGVSSRSPAREAARASREAGAPANDPVKPALSPP